MDSSVFLGWLDDNPKKPVATKIAEAAQRYQQKFGHPATLCLVSQEDYEALTADGNGTVVGVEVAVSARCCRAHFQVGAVADSGSVAGEEAAASE